MLAPPIQLGLQQFLVTLHNANKTVQIACINHDKELKPNIVKLSSLYFCSKKDLTAEYIDGKINSRFPIKAECHRNLLLKMSLTLKKNHIFPIKCNLSMTNFK